MKNFKEFLSETETDYRGFHTAPDPEFGDPMHDVAKNSYPKDFYGPKGFEYYGNHGHSSDREAYNRILSVKDNPEAKVRIFRAVPKDVYDSAEDKKSLINPGDWVTHTRGYADEHGKSVLKNNYKVVSKTVKAHELFNDGDSIHEWGYHPK